MANQHDAWTPEREAKARKLYIEEGWSGPLVAKELGVTKNAIAGLAFRRGWKRSPEIARIQNKRAGQKAARFSGRRPKLSLVQVSEAIIAERKKGVRPATIEAKPDAKTLLQLRFGDCKFPVGHATGADQRFCGRPTMGLGSYCPDCRVENRLTTLPKKPVEIESRRLARWIDSSERRFARS